jgi:hypothetical protein
MACRDEKEKTAVKRADAKRISLPCFDDKYGTPEARTKKENKKKKGGTPSSLPLFRKELKTRILLK